ncbi:MAG: transporter associated domain-containing protein [Candidatus Edwardsbacteria bacterium]
MPKLFKKQKRAIIFEKALGEFIKEEVEKGLVSFEQAKMVQRILKLGNTPLSSIMVPRLEIVSLEAEATVEEISRAFIEKGFSRLPIYDGTPENIVGILFVKEILRFWEQRPCNLRAIEFIRLPFFLPETLKVSEALIEMRRRRISIAIIVNEYGELSGLVTMEDLIEEIVGELRDEFDKEEKFYRVLEDGSYLLEAKMEISRLNEILSPMLESEGTRTLSGLIFKHLQRIPQKGEKFTLGDWVITIVEGNKQRIERVMIKKK